MVPTVQCADKGPEPFRLQRNPSPEKLLLLSESQTKKQRAGNTISHSPTYCCGDCEPKGMTDWPMVLRVAFDPEQEVKSPAELITVFYVLNKSTPGRRIKMNMNEFGACAQ